MRCFCAVVLLSYLLFSCTRGKDAAGVSPPLVSPAPPLSTAPAAPPPLAALQAGKYPLWFQFTDDGPVLIEAIEDACFSAALIPWPLARYIRFILARDNELMMAVNRDGFICLSPWQGGIGLYRLQGGEYWQRYTTGAFFLLGESREPIALLYRDDRFIDSDQPIPQYRLWTFDLRAASPYTMAMPALDVYPPEKDWNIDTLRRGPDANWYFRATRKTGTRPEIRMLRTSDFTIHGEQVSLGAFQNSARPEPVSAAPQVLGKMLGIVFSESGYSAAAVVSPEFQNTRFFAADPDSGAIAGFYSGAFFLAVALSGEAFYIETGSASARRFSLPALPEGFIYTGIGMVAGAVFVSWEEQEGYSIGAAGFMVIEFDSSIAR